MNPTRTPIFATFALFFLSWCSSGVAQEYTWESTINISNTQPVHFETDHRVLLERAAAAVQIEFLSENTGCTGFFISPNHIVTAAHCFSSIRPESQNTMIIRSGFYGEEPQTTFDQWTIQVPPHLAERAEISPNDLSVSDIALVDFNEPQCGWRVGGLTDISSPAPGMELRILHHPTNLPLRTNVESCRVDRWVEDDRFIHTCPTVPGSSGAPLLEAATGHLVGVHGGKRGAENWATSLVTYSGKRLLDDRFFRAQYGVSSNVKSFGDDRTAEALLLVSKIGRNVEEIAKTIGGDFYVFQPENSSEDRSTKTAQAPRLGQPFPRKTQRSLPEGAQKRQASRPVLIPRGRPVLSAYDVSSDGIILPLRCLSPRIPRMKESKDFNDFRMAKLIGSEDREVLIELSASTADMLLNRLDIYFVDRSDGPLSDVDLQLVDPLHHIDNTSKCWEIASSLERDLKQEYGDPYFYRAGLTVWPPGKLDGANLGLKRYITLYRDEANLPISLTVGSRVAVDVRYRPDAKNEGTPKGRWIGACFVVLSVGAEAAELHFNDFGSRLNGYALRDYTSKN